MLPAKKPTMQVNGISKPNDAASSENRSQSRPMISRPVAGSMNRFGSGLVSQSNQLDSPSGPLRNGGNNSWKACLFIVCAPCGNSTRAGLHRPMFGGAGRGGGPRPTVAALYGKMIDGGGIG